MTAAIEKSGNVPESERLVRSEPPIFRLVRLPPRYDQGCILGLQPEVM